MRTLIVAFATLVVSVFAATNKELLMQRAIDLGVTFFTKPEMSKMATCMETPFYDQLNVDKMKSKGINCGVTNCPPMKYIKALDMLKQMDTCLKNAKINMTTMELGEQLYPEAVEIGQPLYDQALGYVGTSKKAKKSKAQCIEDGYGGLLQMAKKELINSVCTKMLKKVPPKAAKCAVTIGAKAVNLKGYKCLEGLL